MEEDEVSIVSMGALLVSSVSDDKDKTALIFGETNNTEELDWFEGVTCGDEESAMTELHKTDWFDEVMEGEEELDDEVGSLGDILVKGFDSKASGGAITLEDATI